MEGLNQQEVQAIVKYWQDRSVDMESKFLSSQVELSRANAKIQELESAGDEASDTGQE